MPHIALPSLPDVEIHDTVLIAAAFCMYNRYVDGLATVQPHDATLYRERGKMVARDGYVAANLTNVMNPSPRNWSRGNMPHINLPTEIPGIGAAFAFRPETAKPMRRLAHILLFEPGTEASLSSRDRELIASYVSSRNTCYFCQTSHGAVAASHVGGSPELVTAVCADPQTADISDKLKALLVIAAHVQGDAKTVTPAHVEAAREQGATDVEIHDTVLIAAAFCMYNRYVDGLATWQPRNEAMYSVMGKGLAGQGYASPLMG